MADVATLSVLIQARDNASQAFKNVEGNMGKMVQGIEKHRRAIGMAMTAIGGAITGVAVMSVKSAFDQEKGIRQLNGALQNIGTSYEKNKAQIEAVVAAQQNKTNFGDEEQRDALRELILVSGSYDKALAALIPTMELAAGKEMDLSAAATLVARAISGEESALNRYGVTVEKGASATEVLDKIMARFAGQAEDAADPVTQLKNRIGDLFQAIGTALLPALEVVVPLIEKMVRRMIEWTEAHPTLTKVLTIVATALGAVMLVLGPMLIILPSLVAGIALFRGGIMALTVAMKANPIGLLTTAIQLIALVALPLLIKNWDTIWAKIKRTTEMVVNFVIGLLNTLTGIWREQIHTILDVVATLMELGSKLPFVGDEFKEAADAVRGFSDRIEEGIPQIDITTDKHAGLRGAVEDTALQYEGTAKDITAANGEIVDSTTEMTVDVGKAHETMADKVKEAREKMSDAARMNLEIDNYISRQLIDNDEEVMAQRRKTSDETFKLIEEGNTRTLKSIEERVQANRTAAEVNEAISNYLSRALIENEMEVNAVSLELGKERTLALQVEIDKRIAVQKKAAEESIKIQEESAKAEEQIEEQRRKFFFHAQSQAGIDETIQRATEGGKTFGNFAGMIRGGAEDTGRQHRINEFKMWAIGFNRMRTDLSQRISNAYALPGDHTSMIAGYQSDLDVLLKQFNDKRAVAYAAARGGIVPMGGANVLVGERGPEVVSLPGASQVRPGAGTVNQFHFHGAVYGVEDLKEAVVEAVRDHAISGGFSGVFAEA